MKPQRRYERRRPRRPRFAALSDVRAGSPVVRLRGEPASYIITLTGPGGPARTGTRGPRDLTPGDLTVFSPASRCQWSALGPFHGIRVRIDPSFLHAQLEALTGVTPLQPVQFALPIGTGPSAGSLLEKLCLLLADATESGDSSLDHPLLRSNL